MSDLTESDPNAPIRYKVFAAAHESIHHNTIPISFYRDGRMTFDRTGILLQVGELHFLVTAAHVGDDGHTIPDAVREGYIPCAVLTGRGSIPVPIDSPKYMTTENPNEDLAVYLLSDGMAATVGEHYRFLRLSQLQSKYHVSHEGAMYLIAGFPQAKLEHEPEAWRVDGWYYLTAHYEGDYSTIPGFNPQTHIILQYERQTRDEDGKTIHPPGMSGCGIWFVANSLTWPLFSASDFRLVGIQTAWHKDHEYAKGTWIDLVLKIIWRYYPAARGPMRLHGMVFDTDHPVILSPPE